MILTTGSDGPSSSARFDVILLPPATTRSLTRAPVLRFPSGLNSWPGCVALALTLACAAPPPAGPVHADFVDGIILLEVTLQGKQGLWILDSGYEYSLLDSATAQAAGIAVSAPASVAEPGGSVSQGWARAVPLEVSGRPFHPDSLAVLPLSGLAPVVGKPLAGLLGHDFFERYVVTIDYASRTVELASPENWRPPAGATETRVWIEDGEPFALATLWVAGRSVPAKLKLDTGSLSGLGLNGSFVAQNRLFPAGWPSRPMEGIAVGGATRNFVSRLDSMEIGGVVIPQPVVGWSEDLARIGDAGTIGAPNLSRFRVTFDYARHRLVLQPRADAAARETWEAAGMLLVQVPGGDVIVAQVLSATPAESAGITAGDRLRRIGTVDAAGMGLDSLRRYFRHPGTTDTLHLDRNGQERVVTLHQGSLP